MDGWIAGQMEERLDGGSEKNIFYCTDSLSLALSLIGALISHTPALNGDAGERNTVEANSYHDFCNN